MFKIVDYDSEPFANCAYPLAEGEPCGANACTVLADEFGHNFAVCDKHLEATPHQDPTEEKA